MSESKFKVGDRVFHIGLGLGTVVDRKKWFTYPISVDFDCGETMEFTHDGRSLLEHTIPQLLTLEEARAKGYDVPKQRVKKKITRWVNVYRYYESDAFSTKEVADKLSTPDRIACVELTGEYFVEE